MVPMAGTKSSVWLSEDLHDRWKDSRLSLTEIVRRGLDAADPEAAAAEAIRAMIREELAEQDDRITGVVRSVIRDELERIAGREG
jgi:hypothetical protein